MLTDDEKLDWHDSRNKMLKSGILCSSFEITSLISAFYWIGLSIYNQIYNQLPSGLNTVLTTVIIIYIAYVPHFQQKTKLVNIKEWINVGFALLGTYMLYTILIVTEFTWGNLPLLILYIWCIITYESYKYFSYWYDRWKRLDEILSIEILERNIMDVNSEIFNLDSTEDKDKIEMCKKYKEFVEKRLEFLKEKYGR